MTEKVEKETKKDVVWIGLRVSFWLMVIIWIGEIIFLPDEMASDGYWTGVMVIVSMLFTISGIFTFVVSIVYLVKHKKKAFAITSLVISSIVMLFFVIGLIAGAIEGVSSEDDIEQYIDSSCQDFCTGVDKVESYNYEYDDTTEVICYCLDENDDIIIQKSLPPPE